MKTENIFLRVTKYEKRQLEEEAARRGMTQSELIRSLIARATRSIFQGRL